MLIPLKNVLVTQEFGHTEFSMAHPEFYGKEGFHNGIDFRCKIGTPVIASFGGVAVKYTTKAGGLSLKIIDGTRTTYYCHLSKVIVDSDSIVKKGQLVALTGDTGADSNAEHLHQSLMIDGKYVNPADYYDTLSTGEPIKNKDWQRSRAYHRYGKKQNALAEFYMKFTPLKIENTWTKSGQWIQKRIVSLGIKRLNDDQYNAIIYGSWGFDEIINPGIMTTALYLTKEEYLSGKKPFNL